MTATDLGGGGCGFVLASVRVLAEIWRRQTLGLTPMMRRKV
jgi:hypothetical protein